MVSTNGRFRIEICNQSAADEATEARLADLRQVQ
jgi:hypothetical protein